MLPLQQKPHKLGGRHRFHLFPQLSDGQPMDASQ
jgi:hypothetical protein